MFAASGFTTFYSVYALYFAPSYIDTCLFAYTLPVAFVSLAIMMGYFIGVAKTRHNRFVDLASGLFIAVIFHGIYRFCLLTSDKALMYLALPAMAIIALTFLYFAVRKVD
jgi:RsiW-degrading membrane proteinase PrsW (M82 family)